VSDTILLGVAWPYANGPLHLGHIAGAYLPPDIFARYHRAKGDRVLMVSGSDTHGTPITVRAEKEGRSPAEVVAEFHASFLESWQQLGITFDLFTTTSTDNHAQTTQEMFLRLLERGHIYEDTMRLLYCNRESRFLPDRYVEGTCPHCLYDGARGDQCDNCGRPLNALDLLNPKCKNCGDIPVPRDSRHFFLRLSAFNEPLKEWISPRTFWRRPVLNWTLGLLNEGLQDRAITRDLEWGIPIPVDGWEDKRIYVWFEAVIGYLSAAREWAQRQGTPDAWKDWWENPDARHYYFVGKDNIPFHTIIWPAMLMGFGGLNLPYDVAVNQYLAMSGSKASTSRGWAVWVPDYLSRYDPDPLRYILSVNMPETNDADFSWAEFVRRNNDELVATWGNLANRVLTFTYRNFEGRIPRPGELDKRDRALLSAAAETFEAVGTHIAACQFKAGINACLALAQQANRYLDETAPWKSLKADRERAATSLFVALSAIATLAVTFYPYLPFTSEQLFTYLGNTNTIEATGWRQPVLEPGTALVEPQPLFRKLDPSVVEEEEARLGH